MDDRQTQIREGAGLEDSRLNEEFVEFLKKWSSPVLIVLACASLAWAGMQYLERKKVEKLNTAFAQLDETTQGGNPSPSSLKTVAEEYKGVGSVSAIALLATTDIYINASVSGIDPSGEIDPLTNQPVMLDADQRKVYLDEAGKTANEVLAMTRDVAGKELLAMQAMSRLASINEGKGDFDGAKAMYESLASAAASAQFPSIANMANARIANLDSIKDLPALPSNADLVPLPGELGPTAVDREIQRFNELMQGSGPEVESDPIADPDSDPASDSDTDSAAEPTTPDPVPSDPGADPAPESDTP